MAEAKKTVDKEIEMVKIKLPRLRGAEADQRVFVAVNGEAYMIKRGEEVEVPAYIKEVLDNSEAQKDAADILRNSKAE